MASIVAEARFKILFFRYKIEFSQAAEKKFGTPFESIAAHKDFVAKINFAGIFRRNIEFKDIFR